MSFKTLEDSYMSEPSKQSANDRFVELVGDDQELSRLFIEGIEPGEDSEKTLRDEMFNAFRSGKTDLFGHYAEKILMIKLMREATEG